MPCHVVGYHKPGGFRSGTATPDKVNVQCENCHGKGTDHDAFGNHPVTAEACMQCHKGDNDPDFNWNTYLPKIVHSNLSGETLKERKQRHTSMMESH